MRTLPKPPSPSAAQRRAPVRFRDLWPGSRPPGANLPPGQHLLPVFPRYGTHFARPIPDLTSITNLKLGGAVKRHVDIPIEHLATMPRREMVADFHCVAGWSAQGLQWGGVPFRTFYETHLAPIAQQGVTHIAFSGVDGFRSVLTLEDAMQDNVMLADHLDGEPLSGHHGGPVRLVSPSQYGYKNCKHLRSITLHTSEPRDGHSSSTLLRIGLRVITTHPRARVDHEERHRYLPAWAVRWWYFHLVHLTMGWLGGRGANKPQRNE